MVCSSFDVFLYFFFSLGWMASMTLRSVRVESLAWTYLWEAQREMMRRRERVRFSFVRRCVLEFDLLFPRIEDDKLANILNDCFSELEMQCRAMERRVYRANGGGVDGFDSDQGYLDEADCESFESFKDDVEVEFGGDRLNVIEEVPVVGYQSILMERVMLVRGRHLEDDKYG